MNEAIFFITLACTLLVHKKAKMVHFEPFLSYTIYQSIDEVVLKPSCLKTFSVQYLSLHKDAYNTLDVRYFHDKNKIYLFFMVFRPCMRLTITSP